MTKKTVVVTGAAGFIGSHLCDELINDNYIIGIDNYITGNKNNLNQILHKPKFELIEEDICSQIIIDKKIDAIYHLASPASPIDYTKFPVETLKVNSIGTENMLKLAKKNQCPILVASTSEVYGDPEVHPQSESYFGNVNPIGPRSMYDEAKRFSESITIAYKNNYKVKVRIARIFNTYGPRMKKNDGRVIPNFINQIINNKNFSVYGNGKQTRSFCYVSDTVTALIKLMESKYTLPVNIGNPNEISIINLVDEINKQHSNNVQIKYEPPPVDDPKKRKPNIDLAKNILDWEPKVNLKTGLYKTFNYYLNKNEY